jgi:uncharacterized protein (DUF1015 family)
MAQVHPFQPYRYAQTAGPIENLVTQPYDKITPAMRSRYLSASGHNLVRVVLGESSPGDTESSNVYTRARNLLNEWIQREVLIRESDPSLYAYFQEFDVPDTGERLVRKSFIGLGDLHEYSEGIVYRHEQTLTGPKKDRMALLEHTRAFFELLFMLYSDPNHEIDTLLDTTAAGADPLARMTDEYGAVHSLWRISDPTHIAAICARMRDKKILIADGHHRYETAVAFRNAHPELEDARRVTMAYVNMHSPGLKILATHRVLKGIPNFDFAAFLSAAKARYQVKALDSLDTLRHAWAEPKPGAVRIGVAGPDGALCMLERDRSSGDLDVAVLHNELLGGLLGIGEEAVRDERHIRYVRGAAAALAEFERGGAQVAFLLEPVTIQQVADVSFSGGVMPQKSTDFYPKLLSGLTIYRLDR